MAKTPIKFHDVLRARIMEEAKETSLLAISNASGVPYSSLHGYVRDGKISGEHVGTLCDHLGLELVRRD